MLKNYKRRTADLILALPIARHWTCTATNPGQSPLQTSQCPSTPPQSTTPIAIVGRRHPQAKPNQHWNRELNQLLNSVPYTAEHQEVNQSQSNTPINRPSTKYTGQVKKVSLVDSGPTRQTPGMNRHASRASSTSQQRLPWAEASVTGRSDGEEISPSLDGGD